MKISEFAAMNNVTTKMLRHYDEIGLLKPSSIDSLTGYRSYEESQSLTLGWILILKNLDFSLQQIQELLCQSISCDRFISELRKKRIEISLAMNEQYQKQIQIEKLIRILEKEGFRMDKRINLLDFDMQNVNELKKNMPRMESFLENIEQILERYGEESSVSFIRFDISHFKQVNDDYGYDIGDKVILACYDMIQLSVKEFGDKATVARMGGDEFAVFMISDHTGTKVVCESIVSRISSLDLSSDGCDKKIGCYLGAIVGKKQSISGLRKLLDDTVEIIAQARQKGVNAFIIEDI